MCIALTIRPRARYVALRLGRTVLVYDWLGLGPRLSTHHLDKEIWRKP